MISKSPKWKYQDLLLLNLGLCSSSAISEAVVQNNDSILKVGQLNLNEIFLIYVLCRDSEKNKELYESRLDTFEFVKNFGYDKMTEKEQWFILSIFRSLVNYIRDFDAIDYSVMMSNMSDEDIEFINGLRKDIMKEYSNLEDKNQKQLEEFNERPQLTKLRNILMIFITESPIPLQKKILEIIDRKSVV